MSLSEPIKAPHKFVALDAFRGIAAIVIVAYHLKDVFSPSLFPHGYLAVDFFFMLSGFVLTYAYQERLDQGLSTLKFLKTRFARLYPLYGLGLGIYLTFRLIQNVVHSGTNYLPASVLVPICVSSLLLVPAPFHYAGLFPFSFPLNPPAWSLFDEIVVNGLHAFFGRKRSMQSLGMVAAVACAVLSVSTYRHGSMDFGVSQSELLEGIGRTIFSYTTGILLFRVWRGGGWKIEVNPLLPAILLIAVFIPRIPLSWRGAYDVVVVVLVMPIILLTGANAKLPVALTSIFESLGLASYAVYMLHFPVFAFFSQIWTHIVSRGAELFAPWSGLLYLAILVMLSLFIDRTYDRTARAFLRRLLLERETVSKAS